MHREAHGLTAARILEVTPELAEAFLGATEINKLGAAVFPGGDEHDPGTRTILFTDIVGSTHLTQRLGDETAFAMLEAHDRIVRAALEAAHGREVKHTGDGIMAVFVSATSALRCGVGVQRELVQYRGENPEQSFQVRIGMAAGEPIARHHDLFGATVQLAARLCAHAEPDQILLSSAVAELCIGKGFTLRDLGQVALRGFDHPVHVHAFDSASKAA